MKRSVIALLTTTLIALSLLGTTYIQFVQAADPVDWYMTVPGVLDTDTYTLYPFSTDESLSIGFSQFGEMINSDENVGLQYGEVDPFAPPAGELVSTQVPKVMWLQGWLINITYVHRLEGPRNVWATAQHSDAKAYGGPWLRVDFAGDWSATYGHEDPRDPGYIIDEEPYMTSGLVHGGRKTNGTAVTEPIQVLYDGPRKFIAQLCTTVYDHSLYETGSTVDDIALVKVIFTIVFNKATKEVNVLKDVKSLLAEKVGLKMKIQFSNRGEVDLGTDADGYSSMAHFYTYGDETREDTENDYYYSDCYGDDWVIDLTEDPDETDWEGYSAAGPFPQSGWASVDVAQAVNPDAGYVWWAAFWPSLSDWSIDGWDQWWQSLDANDPHYIDYRDGQDDEPFIPFYIGEWDFVLYHTSDSAGRTQFRGVTQYGVTDLNDGVDDDTPDLYEDLDSEVLYYLDMKFNPWDLQSSVNKKPASWVWFEDGPYDEDESFLIHPYDETPKDWCGYCQFAERVILLPDGTLLERDVDYTIMADDGFGNITVLMDIAADETLKILWNTWHFDMDWGVLYPTTVEPYYYEDVVWKRWEWGVVGREAQSVDSAGLANVVAGLKNKAIELGLAGEDMADGNVKLNIPSVMAMFGDGYDRSDFYYGAEDYRTAFMDDWCTTWPVARSNILASGGPFANLVSWYGNDWTEAIFGIEPFAQGDIWSGKIAATTCWNKNAYASDADTGYAVVSTTKDLNGTVLLLVWGYDGRDTYYASKWLYGDIPGHVLPGLVQLQWAPCGITSLILEIDYTDPDHPEYSIVELLGTVSEREWDHEYMLPPMQEPVVEEKGGIHDP
jgi:hypothetical protein